MLTYGLQIFIIISIAVNCGANTQHHYIGSENWRIPGAPFVGGIGGFASVFVTASFACKSNPMHLCPSDQSHGTDDNQTAARNPSPSRLERRRTRPGTSLGWSRTSSGASSSSSKTPQTLHWLIRSLTASSILSVLLIGLNVP